MSKNELMITEREFIMRLSLITGHNKDVVKDVFRAISEFVIDEIGNGIPVRLGNLGEFTTVKTKCQGGYNFRTKKMEPMKEVNRVKFKCSAALRKAAHQSD